MKRRDRCRVPLPRFSSLAAACGATGETARPRAAGYVEATEVRVRRKSPAVIELKVDEGERVAAGDVLGAARHADVDLALRRAVPSALRRVAQLRLLQAGARPEDIRQAEAQVAAAHADTRAAEAELARRKRTCSASSSCSRSTPARASSATTPCPPRAGRRARASRPASARARRPKPGALRAGRAPRRSPRPARASRRSTRRSRRCRRPSPTQCSRRPSPASSPSRLVDPASWSPPARRSSSSSISIARGRTSTSKSRWCRR